MVTVELAVGVLVSALLLTVLSGVVGLVILQDRCRDVAGLIAREIGRGDARGEARARTQVPAGSTVDVRTSQGWVRVTVTTEQRWGRLGPVTLTGSAEVPLELGEPER
ncbi:TadE family type IV pilus minor pilin [Aestuariimicrobium ganziense]|uniref:TadE family type IV pilus minor pilin n=1 Tax=Aestuariimicrobium ganziense TaxID=2773677 RepID=UPI0019431DE4|nr:TadE family type IV pilus minor pilin [Aestuariimicrobium ganziense]